MRADHHQQQLPVDDFSANLASEPFRRSKNIMLKLLLLALLVGSANAGIISLAASFVPIPFVGGVVGVICGTLNLNPLQIGMGVGSLVLDAATAGTASSVQAATKATTEAAKCVVCFSVAVVSRRRGCLHFVTGFACCV
jgi:hypothetical protein